MTAAIETVGLTRDFGSLRALDHLTVTVPAGCIFGFLGPNGAGKTTTIRLLLGLLAPTAGQARVLGFDPWKQGDAVRARVGVLLDALGLYDRLTALENLEFFGRIWHLSASERRARSEALLRHFELWDRRNDPVGQWSRGMRQKLAIARALLHRPALVFFDEPTAGLDPVAAAALREDIARLVAQEGVTVFLTTHNLAEAERLCHLVGVIRQGRLLAVGTLAELRARQGQPRLVVVARTVPERAVAALRAQPGVEAVTPTHEGLVVTLHDSSVDTAPLVSLLVQQGVDVAEVRREQASLEDVFLTLMAEESQAEAQREVV
jgi:ABC-2 type transport system ATP-binding protein